MTHRARRPLSGPLHLVGPSDPVLPPTLSGVFVADPATPIPAPAGASAIEIRNRDGATIAYAWVVAAGIADAIARSYDFLDQLESDEHEARLAFVRSLP